MSIYARVQDDSQLFATISPSSANIFLGGYQQFTSTVTGGVSPYSYQWYLNNTAVSVGTSQNWKFTPTEVGTYKIYLNITDSSNNTVQSNIVTSIVVNQSQSTRGVVTIAFDDSEQSQYVNAYPLMKARGLVGTFYVITNFIGDGSHLTVAELQDLQANGNEIGSHSESHPDFVSLTEDQIRAECSGSKQILQSDGLTVNNFAYPYGDHNDFTDSIVSQYYRSIRSAYVEPYIMSLPTSQAVLQGYPGESGDPSVFSQFDAMLAAESEVDQVATNGGWVIIFFHNVVWGDFSDPYSIAAEYFTDFLDHVQASNVSVLTVNQALEIAGPSLSASISPTSGNLNPGNSLQFTSNVSGGVSPYTYQWYLNNSAILGASSPNWTFQPTSTGTYKINLRASDSYINSVKSNNATVLVTLPLTASINPSSANITIGAIQQFTSNITGGLTPYTYQWYYANGTTISGDTSSLAYRANFTGTYTIYINVTDGINNRTRSNTATFNVYSQPSVTISPVSVNITVGTTQQFNSTTAGGLIPYIYQWYYANSTAILGATTSTLVYKANFTGTYNIYLNITDSVNFRVESNTATINVYSQPTVTISPASVNLTVGTTQQFNSTTAGGLTPYIYQWYYANGTAISGATSSLVYRANFTGTYNIYLNVTDSLNNRTKSNTTVLNVYSQPSVTISPTSITTTIGATKQFTSTVTGGLIPYAYQWYLNDTEVSGATAIVWNFTPMTTGHFTVYLNVTDALSYKVQSNIVSDITVNPQSTVTISPTIVNMTTGSSQIFSSTVGGGTVPYSYQWYRNGTLVSGATSSSWVFTPASIGTYNIYLNVTDSSGVVSKSDIAAVRAETAMIIGISPTLVRMYFGQTQTFNSSVSGGTSPYAYQWYLNDTAVLGAHNPNWGFTPISAGSYRVYLNVTSALNLTAQSNIVTEITVYPQLTVSINPTSVNMTFGTSQLFNSNVTGGLSPYTYQWFLNNTAVLGATNANWTFTPRANGHYQIYLNATDNNGRETKSNVTANIDVYSVYLLLNIDPHSPYTKGQQSIVTVTVLNQKNPQLNATLTLSVTGPAGYCFYDFQPITVPANSINEYSFNWLVPNATGTYMIETSLVPVQLTAYDAKCLQLSEPLNKFADSSGQSPVTSKSLVTQAFTLFVLVGSQSMICTFTIVLPMFKDKKLVTERTKRHRVIGQLNYELGSSLFPNF
jgi:peptidoglycan/xylan/chitin deacetylase (PgdA/CDA1 family)